jgi:hypothetical protein
MINMLSLVQTDISFLKLEVNTHTHTHTHTQFQFYKVLLVQMEDVVKHKEVSEYWQALS